MKEQRSKMRVLKFEPGQPCPINFKVEGGGSKLNFFEDGPLAFLILPEMSNDDLAAIMDGDDLRTGVLKTGRTGFLLLDFGVMEFELPFDVGATNPGKSYFPNHQPFDSVSLSFVCVEAATNTIICFRNLEMSPRESYHFVKILREQAKSPISFDAHAALVEDAFCRYPTTESMFKDAVNG